MRSTVLTSAATAVMVVAAWSNAAVPLHSVGRHPAIIASLNAERRANGIPAHVLEDTAWSKSCTAHVAYMASTGLLEHDEDPSNPAYSRSGSWAAAHAVLGEGISWQNGNPFETAPIHLIQLMSPELRRVGVDEDAHGYLCMTTYPGYRASGWRKPTVYSDPGPGADQVPAAETANEQPFVPGDFVGLRRGTKTGFNIMVYAEGTSDPWHVRIAAATLTGPGGRVAVRTVDRMTRTVGPYLPPASGFVIPVKPLAPGTIYRVTVRFSTGLRHSWSFRTAGASPLAAGVAAVQGDKQAQVPGAAAAEHDGHGGPNDPLLPEVAGTVREPVRAP